MIFCTKGLSITALSLGIFSPEIRGDLLLFVPAVVVSIFSIASIILYLCWLYRVNSNARSFGIRQMFFTPGWSVGCHFIPIANIVRPYQIMKGIVDVTFTQNRGNILSITGCWWLTYIFPSLLGFCWSQYLVATNVLYVPPPIWLFPLSILFSIIHLCCFVVMVHKITKRQVELSETPIIIPAENQIPVKKPMGCCYLGFVIILCAFSFAVILRIGVRQGIIPKPSVPPTLQEENYEELHPQLDGQYP
ncbi:MAG: DUF4328 domain-containing protein [Planctomycetaceae bacterium]|nr:DUF4328 domain-containing protein [Planctomycetaceae bacterium]